MSFTPPDPLLSVRTGQTATSSPTGPYGQMMSFDFSGDIGEGQSILAYGVALSGWCLDYVTNSAYWAENLGLLGVNLVPNLCGTALYVTANPYMSDNDGDAAGFPSDNSPPTLVQVTATALIGSQPVQDTYVGNVYGIANGGSSPAFDIGTNPVYGAWMSGFMLSSDAPGDVGMIGLAANLSGPTNQQFTVNSVATTTDVPTSGSIDTFVLSYPYSPSGGGSQSANFQIVSVGINWGSVDEESGLTGTFSATFSPPTGMSITNWGILQQQVTLDYTDDELMLAAAQYVGNFPTSAPSGNTVDGSFVLNIMNPDLGHHDWIKSSSNAQISIIAQFG